MYIFAAAMNWRNGLPSVQPRRRAMLLLVRDQPSSVNEIASHFEISQQAVSQHLQVLKDAGLVAVRPEGQRRLYVVRPQGLEAIQEFLALWPESLERLKASVETESGVATDLFTTSVVVQAAPEEVYDYLTRAELLLAWMGRSSTSLPLS